MEESAGSNPAPDEVSSTTEGLTVRNLPSINHQSVLIPNMEPYLEEGSLDGSAVDPTAAGSALRRTEASPHCPDTGEAPVDPPPQLIPTLERPPPPETLPGHEVAPPAGAEPLARESLPPQALSEAVPTEAASEPLSPPALPEEAPVQAVMEAVAPEIPPPIPQAPVVEASLHLQPMEDVGSMQSAQPLDQGYLQVEGSTVVMPMEAQYVTGSATEGEKLGNAQLKLVSRMKGITYKQRWLDSGLND